MDSINLTYLSLKNFFNGFNNASFITLDENALLIYADLNTTVSPKICQQKNNYGEQKPQQLWLRTCRYDKLYLE